MRATFIFFPGWITISYPEDTVDLGRWVGTRAEGVQVPAVGEKDPEVEAAKGLRVAGIYGKEYELRRQGEHQVLYRPASQRRAFTMSAPYRISRWTICPAKETSE